MIRRRIPIDLCITTPEDIELVCFKGLEVICVPLYDSTVTDCIYDIVHAISQNAIPGAIYHMRAGSWQSLELKTPLIEGGFYKFQIFMTGLYDPHISNSSQINNPLIVLDIDETLVTTKITGNSEPNELIEVPGGPERYAVFPGVVELLRYVVLEKKLQVAFFSHGGAKRNELLIPRILERAFPECNTQELMSNFPIFSREHMLGKLGKDLNVVIDHFKKTLAMEIPLKNVILIDDSASFTVKGQHFLRVPKRECKEKRIFSVVGILDELILNGGPFSSFLLQQHHQERTIASFTEEGFQSFIEKGLDVLRRINPNLKLNESKTKSEI
jgi:hypothetical protein